MAFEDDFLECMVDEVAWEKFTGTDANSNRQYGPPKTLQCRVSPKTRQVLTADGASVVSHSTVYPAGSPDISTKDRITLPNGEQPPILRIERPPDRDGPHHTEVMI